MPTPGPAITPRGVLLAARKHLASAHTNTHRHERHTADCKIRGSRARAHWQQGHPAGGSVLVFAPYDGLAKEHFEAEFESGLADMRDKIDHYVRPLGGDSHRTAAGWECRRSVGESMNGREPARVHGVLRIDEFLVGVGAGDVFAVGSAARRGPPELQQPDPPVRV
jgi:hypothetical protein